MLKHTLKLKTEGAIDKLKMDLSYTQLSKYIMLTWNTKGTKIVGSINETQSLIKNQKERERG